MAHQRQSFSDEASRNLIQSRKCTLWGRQQQIAKLKELAELVQQDLCRLQLALIHGPSGSGKTSLFNNLKAEFSPKHRFLFGKFDQYHDNSSPYSALVQAFEKLVSEIQQRQRNANPESSFELAKEALGADISFLCQLIPSEKAGIKSGEASERKGVDGASTSATTSVATSNSLALITPDRLAVAMTAFLGAICTPQHPVVLAIDDLQWADAGSLNVLRVIANASREIRNLLVIGIYRDPEVSDDETLWFLLHDFAQSVHHLEHVHDVQVANLSTRHTSSFVLELLAIDPSTASADVTQSSGHLAALIHRKTFGNPYFIVQCLVMLQQNGLLQYDSVTEKWMWDQQDVEAGVTTADNVLVVLTSRLQCLPSALLRLLQLAACLGFVFDVHLLELVFNQSNNWQSVSSFEEWDTSDGDSSMEDAERENDMAFAQLIERAVSEDLFQPHGRDHQLYRFTHDKLHQSVYDIPMKRRDQIHWDIGSFVRKMTNDDEKVQSRYLFLAADQLNRGSSCILSEEERMDLVRLNYSASQAAMKQNGVDLIKRFLNEAVSLIREGDWETSYE